MGTATMTEETTTRRRHKSAKKRSTNYSNTGTSIDPSQHSLHVQNGNDNDGYQNGRISPSKKTLKVATTKTTKEQQEHERLLVGKRRKKKRRRAGRNDPPFPVLVFQVGMTLFLILSAVYFMIRWIWPNSRSTTKYGNSYDDDDGGGGGGLPGEEQQQKFKLSDLIHLDQKDIDVEAAEETAPPLPHFNLSEAIEWDAYGLASQFEIHQEDDQERDNQENEDNADKSDFSNSNSKNKVKIFWKAAEGLRERFAEYYGGENAARMLIDRGLTTFSPSTPSGVDDGVKNGESDGTFQKNIPADIVSTACRLQRAQREKRAFRVAFGGYSVTAGRGNLFQDSFPFRFQDTISTVIRLAGIPDIVVNNAAIGGCPAFPYGWCMKNFWGEKPDVVSWDYSMNEAGGVPEGLEAYVRHILSTYSENPPKLIVKDTHLATKRRDVLGAYQPLLRDSVVIHTDPAVKPFLEIKEKFRPEGFQEWRQFGAPYGAPGQALHHPAVKEHEFIGWLLAMHFLTALEYLVAKGNDLPCPTDESILSLPEPVSGDILNTTDIEYEGILFGHKTESSSGGSSSWTMNPVHCRTTFQPQVYGDLSEIVVSGTTAEDLDILLPKSQMYYNQGWTLDLSEGEKAAKRKLSLYEDSLGFIDSKEAYYGIYESPEMSLFIPFEGTTAAESPDHQPLAGGPAADWFESIVICQVNEKRDATACNFGTDVGLVIGGANATDSSSPSSSSSSTNASTSNHRKKILKDEGTLFLGRPMCLSVQIPSDAILTSHNQLDKTHILDPDPVGVLVEIFVNNRHIVHVNQACSISHVIWEEKKKNNKK